jgi:hypothetical protein
VGEHAQRRCQPPAGVRRRDDLVDDALGGRAGGREVLGGIRVGQPVARARRLVVGGDLAPVDEVDGLAPMTPICARGQASSRSAPSSRLFIAMKAPPNALRRTTVSRGTEAAAKAWTSLAPWRMMPPASCPRPGRKPGVSTRTTSGRP